MRLFSGILPDSVKPYAGRIVLTALGLLVAILFLTIGFWRTLLLVLLCAAGYLVGKWEDGALDMDRLPLPGRWR